MLISDKIYLSIGEADFLFKDTAPLVCVEKQTVFPIDRRLKGFLLENKMFKEKILCKGCYQKKNIEEFYKNKFWRCKECYNKQTKKWREKDIGNYRLVKKKWRDNNRDKMSIYWKRYRLKYKEKFISREFKDKANQRMKIFKEKCRQQWFSYLPKNPVCSICNKPLKYFNGKKGVVFDHCNAGTEPIKCFPSQFLSCFPLNQKNLALWKSSNFGVLCR